MSARPKQYAADFVDTAGTWRLFFYADTARLARDHAEHCARDVGRAVRKVYRFSFVDSLAGEFIKVPS